MATAQSDAALETLAALFRAISNYPLVTKNASAAALYGGHEDWARHLLTGAPPPGSLPPSAERQWVSAQMFFRERRQAEQTYVQRRERELSGLAQDLLLALRDASDASSETAGVVEAGLQLVQDRLANNTLDQLRSEFAGMAARLRTAMAGQRAMLDQQLGEMRQRVQTAERAQAESETQARELGKNLADSRQALDDARQQMQLDPLTQIYNRGAFDDALRRYTDLGLASEQTLALVMLDLDHFKTINDNHGHTAGDAVLTAFAGLLSRSFLRADDFAARYGGEEFAVLLFVNDPVEVVRLVEALLERVRKMHLPQLDGTTLTCSGGYALLEPGSDATDLVKRADAALYQAKHNGRDRLCAAAETI